MSSVGRHGPVFIWTRTEIPTQLKNLSPSLLHITTIRIEKIRWRVPASPDYILVSSATVAELARHDKQLLLLLKRHKVLTFGAVTLKSLRDLGVRAKRLPGCNTGSTFARVLVRSLPPSASLLAVGASKPAFGMVKYLQVKGFQASALAVYRTREGVFSSKGRPVSLKRVLSDATQMLVCFASPSAVRGFCSAVPRRRRKDVTAVCIGPTTAQEAKKQPFNKIVTSKRATAAGLAAVALKTFKLQTRSSGTKPKRP